MDILKFHLENTDIRALYWCLYNYGPPSNGDRNENVKELGYANLSMESIRELSLLLRGYKVLSIGSGVALNEAILQKIYDITTIATDPFLTHNTTPDKVYMKVQNMTAQQAIMKHGDKHDVLLLSWPYINNDDDWDFQALKLFHQLYPTKKFVYIGEEKGGCTGTSSFHDYLNNHFTLCSEITYPNWALPLHGYAESLAFIKEQMEKITDPNMKQIIETEMKFCGDLTDRIMFFEPKK